MFSEDKMANPNIVNVTSIYGNTALENLSTATVNVITNSAGSGSVDKINNILLTNRANSTISANVSINRNDTIYLIGSSVSIPANSVLVLLAKDSSIYMIEGDVLQANTSTNDAITLIASYERIS